MAISSVSSSPTQVSTESKSTSSTQQSLVEYQKSTLNISILQSTEATLSIKDQPLSLVLRAAIEKINEQLAPFLGENAIENAAASGIDFSPEATADRIVTLSTAFFSAFKDQHPNEAQNAVLDNFLKTISGGIDQGFQEARDILESLNVLQGDIANNIDKTYELVQQGLQKFREQFTQTEAESISVTA